MLFMSAQLLADADTPNCRTASLNLPNFSKVFLGAAVHAMTLPAQF